MKPYEDPANPNNSPAYHTGKPCVEPDCSNPAGTAWSPFWCQACNARRLELVSTGLAVAQARLAEQR